MKHHHSRRMQKGGRSARKDSSDKDGTSGRSKSARDKRLKKGGAGTHDDDVDSHGNIRGLIAYSSDEDSASSNSGSWHSDDESVDSHLTPEEKQEIRRSARKAAIKARERIHRRIAEEESPKKKSKGRKQEKSRKQKEEESEEEESEEEESEEESPKKKSKRKSKQVIESEDEEEEEEEDEDEDEEDEDEDEDEDDEDEESEEEGPHGISISFGGFGDELFAERMKPKRYNLKKEPESVKKFVKLITKPMGENTIDDQIDQFKALPEEKQTQMLTALDRKPSTSASENLMFRILTMNMPNETQQMVLSKYNSLQTLEPGSGEYFKLRAWLEKLTSLPLGIYKELPVKIEDGSDTCGVFMEKARKYLAEAIYGQEEAKLQILQFIAGKIANPTSRGTSLLLAGPPGIGKTSLIRDGIAKAIGWPFQFISLGGDSDASTYTGHQLVYESSHCGKIVNSLVAAKSLSMVLMFDELDKISTTAKGEEVMNLLIHLTDPVQNSDFEDKYLAGIPIDLSRTMFAFSANDMNKIDKVLLDRLVVVNLSGYSAKEKLAIAENFLVPAALKEVHLDEKVSISKDVLQYIIEEYSHEEAGVRELKRSIEQIVQKVNMLRIFNNKDLPFHISDFHLPFVVKKDHVALFLKKKAGLDVSVQRMYS